MILSNPQDRPSAPEIIAMFDATDIWRFEEDGQTNNIDEALLLDQLQKMTFHQRPQKPNKVHAMVDPLGEFGEDAALEPIKEVKHFYY
jgi:hypothetical protein